MHGSTIMSFQRQVTVLNGSEQTGHRSEISGLGHKKRETWLGLITDFATNMLSFSTPTHAHDFGNHNDGYSHSKTGFVRSVSGYTIGTTGRFIGLTNEYDVN
jgi:hypothetical protein